MPRYSHSQFQNSLQWWGYGSSPVIFLTVLLIRIRHPGSGAFLTFGYGIWDGYKVRIWTRDPDPGWTTRIIFLELRNHFFGLNTKILWWGSGIEKFGSGIRHKHRGSATLISYLQFRDLHWQPHWDLGVRDPDLLPVHPGHAGPAGGGDQVLGKLESCGSKFGPVQPDMVQI